MPKFLEEWVKSLTAEQYQELYMYFTGGEDSFIAFSDYDVPFRDFLELLESAG